MPRLWPRRAHDQVTLDLFEEAGRNVRRATILLRELLVEHPDRADLRRDLVSCEREGDRITRAVLERLDGGGAGRIPFDPGDGHALATALDDIVDHAEQAADQLSMYSVEATMDQAIALGDVLVGAAEEVAGGLQSLRAGADLAPHLMEIHRLEDEGDRVSRDAVASLFANGIDPMVVIRWKDIFESLGASVDACGKVAHVLEGITIKHGAKR